jgi:hypothetical protein
MEELKGEERTKLEAKFNEVMAMSDEQLNRHLAETRAHPESYKDEPSTREWMRVLQEREGSDREREAGKGGYAIFFSTVFELGLRFYGL